MARGNIRGDDDDEVSQHRHFHWSLKDIPRFEGHEGEQPFLHLMEFEDYLVASGVSIEPKEIRGNIVQPDYKDIINKFKASLKNNARIWFSMYIEKRVPNLHSADGWEIVKSKFLTYFNPLGSTKEQQIQAWKEMVWKPEKEKLTDFVFRFSQLAHELGYSDEQQISHFVLCIPRGLYLYLKGAQTIPDAVENLRRGIALGGLDIFNSNPTLVQDDSKPTSSYMTMKENKTQFTTDTLRAVKESIQDSMYDNNRILGGILDEIGDRLANVVKTSSRDRDRDRSPSRSRGRNNLRDNYRNRSRSRDRDDSRDHPTDNYRDRDRGKSNSRNERNGRRKHQRSGTGQRNFDNIEFCNYCDITGHTTHRCYKLTDYLKRKGKKIISHDEEEVQELAQAVQNLSLKLNSLKVRTSTNY